MIVVETLVSSMKTSRFRSSLGCCFCKALRPAVTSGRSCSAARRLFFKAQIQMMQESEDRRLTDRHLLLRQKALDLCQRDIRLLRHQLPDQFLVRGQSISLVPAEFGRTNAVSRCSLRKLTTELILTPSCSAVSGMVAPSCPHQQRAHADPPNTVSPSMLASTPAQTLNPIRSRRGIPRFSLFGKCSNMKKIARHKLGPPGQCTPYHKLLL